MTSSATTGRRRNTGAAPAARGRPRTSPLGIAFAIPTVALLGVFFVWPIARAFQISLFEFQGLGPLDEFVGLGNYARAIVDPQLWLGLGRNVFYAVFLVVGAMLIGTTLAYLLFRRVAGTKVLQVLLFLPAVVPVAVVALLWRYIFQPSLGLLDQLLRVLGLTDGGNVWLGDPSKAVVLVAIAWLWTTVPIWTLLLFVAMLNVPPELLESAQLDGAGHRRTLVSVIVPHIRPMIATLVMMTVLASFRQFDLVYLMAQQVPGNSMTTAAMYVYKQAFEFNNYGYGTALGFIVAIVIALILPLIVRQSESKEFKE